MRRETQETLDQVRARIAQAEAERQAELDEKLATFDKEVSAPRAAKAAAARQAAEQQREQKVQAEAEARFEREHMAPAKQAWLANGGTLAEFESAKPQLRKEKLAQLALGGKATREQWRRQATRRYR